MKLTKKNISYFISIVLIASFTISFSHTVIEQLGSACANHDDHDFSKVIVNVVLQDNSNQNNDLNLINQFFTPAPDNLFISDNFSGLSQNYFHHPPSIYSDRIFITKFKSLLI